MHPGRKRTLIGRFAAAIGLLCGVLGVAAGTQDVVWKFGSTGWFTGGSLLTLLALFELVDGALAHQWSSVMPATQEPESHDEPAASPVEKTVWRPKKGPTGRTAG